VLDVTGDGVYSLNGDDLAPFPDLPTVVDLAAP